MGASVLSRTYIVYQNSVKGGNVQPPEQSYALLQSGGINTGIDGGQNNKQAVSVEKVNDSFYKIRFMHHSLLSLTMAKHYVHMCAYDAMRITNKSDFRGLTPVTNNGRHSVCMGNRW